MNRHLQNALKFFGVSSRDVSFLVFFFFLFSLFTFQAHAASSYSLSGYIFNDISKNGVKDQADAGINGTTVVLKDLKGKETILKTNANGLYSFSPTTSGTYTISVTVPSGYILTTPQNKKSFYVGNGSEKVTVNFGLTSQLALQRVTFDQAICSDATDYDSCAVITACVWDSGRCVHSYSQPNGATCEWDWSCQQGTCTAGKCGTGGGATCGGNGLACCNFGCQSGLICAGGMCRPPTTAEVCQSFGTTVCATNSQICTTDPNCNTTPPQSHCDELGGVSQCTVDWCSYAPNLKCTLSSDCHGCFPTGGGTGPSCGDGACNNGENHASCPADCPATGGTPYCGDNVCNNGENGNTCPTDCPVQHTGPQCGSEYCDDPNQNICMSFPGGDQACVSPQQNGIACNNDNECTSGFCNPSQAFGGWGGVCATRGIQCGSNFCSQGQICDGDTYCHTPHDQPDGEGCLDNSEICQIGSSCQNNVCTPDGGTGGSCDSISNQGTCTARNDCYWGFNAGANRCINRIASGEYCQVPGSNVCVSGNSCVTDANNQGAHCCPSGQTFSNGACRNTTTGATYTINLNPTTIPEGTVGTPYTLAFALHNSSYNLNYTAGQIIITSNGTLPPGLSLHLIPNNNWKIDGTPTQAGTFAFAVRVCMANDPNICVNGDYAITIHPGSGTTCTTFTNQATCTANTTCAWYTNITPNVCNIKSQNGASCNDSSACQSGNCSQTNNGSACCPAGQAYNGTQCVAGGGNGTVTVTFLQPSNGAQISQTTLVKIKAETAQGATITQIKACLDDLNGQDCDTASGNRLAISGTTATAQFNLDPSDEPGGNHDIIAQATDSTNKTGQNKITINIKNGNPTSVPTKKPTTAPTSGGNPTSAPTKAPTAAPTSGNPTATPGGPTATPGGPTSTPIPTQGEGNPTATPTISPTPGPVCNSSCARSACPSGYSCLENQCRANACLTDSSCSCVAPTATPTLPPGVTPTVGASTPTPTLPAGVTPTVTPTPTVIPDTLFKVSATLPGIGGATGDNPTPKHPSRDADVFLYDSKNAEVAHGTGTVDYNNGVFSGTIPVSALPSGSYLVKVKLENTLKQLVSTKPIAVLSGQTVNLAQVVLVSGDLNNDNQLSVVDYNILIGCFGNKLCATKDIADLNDDGKVEEKDVNILIRGFALQ